MDKFTELRDELKIVFSGRGAGILDALIPLLVFIIANRFLPLRVALLISLVMAAGLLVLRLTKKQSPGFALGGLGSAALAAAFSFLSGSAGGYYLPGFLTGGLTVLGCFGSVLLRRPLAAYSSRLTRRWPAAWYWHSRVRPAYSEVSILWGAAFGIRLVIELTLYFQGRLDALGTVRVLMGWPYTILVLVLSYIYGQKRLQQLQGPSVEEFKADAAPPWSGQQRGF